MTRHSRIESRPRHRLASWLGRNWARLHYARRVEPTWLEINRFDITIAGLSPAFDGLRIVQVSDMHCGGHLPADYHRDVMTRASAEKPDLIALTGDFVHKGFKFVEHAAQSVSELSAPDGVFAVLGNHDHSIRNALGVRRHRSLSRMITEALANRGVRVLDNESVIIRRGDDLLHIVGVDDLWSRKCDLERALNGLDPNSPRVVLAHNPRTIEQLAGRRCDLMLSGHTHGGQINVPKLGRVTLGKRARRYAAGLYQQDSTQLYVNKGVGCGVRFRFGVRPEIAVFQLHCGN